MRPPSDDERLLIHDGPVGGGALPHPYTRYSNTALISRTVIAPSRRI